MLTPILPPETLSNDFNRNLLTNQHVRIRSMLLFFFVCFFLVSAPAEKKKEKMMIIINKTRAGLGWYSNVRIMSRLFVQQVLKNFKDLLNDEGKNKKTTRIRKYSSFDEKRCCGGADAKKSELEESVG